MAEAEAGEDAYGSAAVDGDVYAAGVFLVGVCVDDGGAQAGCHVRVAEKTGG